MAGLGIAGMRSGVDGLRAVYEDRVVPLRDLKTVSDLYAVDVVDTCHKVRNANITPAEGLRRIEHAEQRIRAAWRAYLRTGLTREESGRIDALGALMARGDTAIERLKTLLRAEDHAGIAQFAATELYPAIEPITAEVKELVQLQLDVAHERYRHSADLYAMLRNANIGILLLAGVVAFGTGRMLLANLAEARMRDWRASGMNELHGLMQGEQPLASLGESVLRFVVTHVGAVAATLQVVDGRRRELVPVASHGTVPAGAQVLRVPLLRDYREIGLIEIVPAGTGGFDQRVSGFLELAARVIAINISVLTARAHVDELLAQTQAQAAELDRQKARLLAANEELRAANEHKTQFLANISHEIRTPINAILGMTHLALRTTLDAQQRDYLDKTHAAGASLLGLVDELLEYASLEAGTAAGEQREFALDALFGELDAAHGTSARAKGLEFAIVRASDVPARVHGDEVRLRRVLQVLCGNAVKFTDRGEILLSVESAQRKTGDGPLFPQENGARPHFSADRLRFEVRDTGIGLGVGQAARLFKPFTQADGSSTRRHGGTGLGLALARELVELMGGEIGVAGTPGVGSTFWFTIPLAPVVAVAQAPVAREPARAGDSENMARIRGQRILVVEDNELNQQVATELLEGIAGATVELAADGAQALSLVLEQARRFDAVLMDLQMPVMDGHEATRELRRHPHLDAMPIIALTAHALASERAACLEEGMNDFVTKPVEPARLFAVLARWLEQPR